MFNLLNKNEVVCASCGKLIKERKRFILLVEERRKYSSYFKQTNLLLYFHEKCIVKISVKISNIYDLLKVMRKLEG